MAEHNEIGKIGEIAVLNHLKRKGYRHLESNYRQKPGELDLIMKRNDVVHFVEVKTVSREKIPKEDSGVPHETHRPVDNVHSKKLRNILNTIQIWLSQHEYEGEWQLDVASVWLSKDRKKGRVAILENVIVE